MALGEIIVWGRLQEPSKPIDLIAIEHGTTVAALKMMEMRSIAEAEDAFGMTFWRGCSLPPARAGACHPTVERPGQPAFPPYAVVLVGPDLPGGTTLTTVQTFEKRIWTPACTSPSATSAACGRMCPAGTRARAGRLRSFPAGNFPASRTEPVPELRRSVIKSIAENDPYTVSMGISPGMSELDDFRLASEMRRPKSPNRFAASGQAGLPRDAL